MTIERYSSLIHQLNTHIDSFNGFLAEGHKLKKIAAEDPSTFSEILEQPWAEQHWPSKDDAGVYVLCGRHETDISRVGAYVGKASLKNIGYRLWSHLTRYRKTGIYKFGGDSSESFIVEAILAVPITAPTTRAIASALEEHILVSGLQGIQLFNTVGRRA